MSAAGTAFVRFAAKRADLRFAQRLPSLRSYSTIDRGATSPNSIDRFELNRSARQHALGKHLPHQNCMYEQNKNQRRSMSLFNRIMISAPPASPNVAFTFARTDLDSCITLVKRYDPSGYLPGLLVPSHARIGYYAVRAFWVETGLRLSNLLIKPDASSNFGSGSKTPMTPVERLHWWRKGVEELYAPETSSQSQNHPVLRLLRHTVENHSLSKEHLDRILDSREAELGVSQYDTVDHLADHARRSCGSALHLMLECTAVSRQDNPAAYEVADLVGTCHGITNALRGSIPVLSNTGRMIVPQELCDKYGVKSPRFLLMALSQGDPKCTKALQSAVEDLAAEARRNLDEARGKRKQVLAAEGGEKAVAVMLPGVASETFLSRLGRYENDLTSTDLRRIDLLEHATCTSKMVMSWMNKTY